MLHREDSSHRFINAARRYFSFLRQLEQEIAEAVVRWHHAHVHSGHHPDASRFLFVRRDVMHGNKFLDVHPIRDHESLQAELTSQYILQQITVGVPRDPVHFARIHHDRVRPGFHRCRKRRKKVFAQSIFRNKRRAAVPARGWVTVTHIMFQRSRNADRARNVASLVTANRRYPHHLSEVRIFSKRLPQARPQRLPSGVKHRRE